jgi:hypothetical protein
MASPGSFSQLPTGFNIPIAFHPDPHPISGCSGGRHKHEHGGETTCLTVEQCWCGREVHTTLAAAECPQYNARVGVPNCLLQENPCRAKRRHRRTVNPWSRQRIVKTSRSLACFI